MTFSANSQNAGVKYVYKGRVTEFHSILNEKDSCTIIGFTTSENNSFSAATYLLHKIDSRGNTLRDYSKSLDSFDVYSTENIIKNHRGNYVFTANANGSEQRNFIEIDKNNNAINYKAIKNRDTIYPSYSKIIQLSDSNYMISGITYDLVLFQGQSNFSYFILNKEGNEIFSKTFLTPYFVEWDPSIQYISNKNILMTYNTSAVIQFQNDTFKSNLVFFEVNQKGDSVKKNAYKNPKVVGTSNVLELPQRDYLFGGYIVDTSYWYNSSLNDYVRLLKGYIALVDSNLNIKWELKLGYRSSVPQFNKIIALQDGNFLAVGAAYDTINKDSGVQSGWVIKFNKMGNILWEKKYQISYSFSENDNVLKDVIELPNGDLVACGYVFDREKPIDDTSHPQKGWILRMDKNGIAKSSNIEVIELRNIPRIYPNPCRDNINIIFPREVQCSRIEVYNLQGKKIKEIALSYNKDIQIELEGLVNGYYIINFFDKNDSVFFRTRIEKSDF